MKKELLPIGSVVMLEGGTKPLMVTGYRMKENAEAEKVYDYVGCVFPEGFMERIYSLFDQANIKEVMFVGYEDDEAKDYTYNIANGIVSGPTAEAPEGPMGGNRRVRKPKRKAPTKPLSASEMFAKYTKEVISGGETEKYDFDNVDK